MKTLYNSPAGALLLEADNDALTLCDWAVLHPGDVASALTREATQSTIVLAAIEQLDEYFAGRRKEFDIKLAPRGTAFQHQVWDSLIAIPYSTTTTYGKIARRIGRPTAVRAVAGAIGANPISIFIPCHRVIGANGTLTGYAGGLHAKRVLLTLEQQTGLFDRYIAPSRNTP